VRVAELERAIVGQTAAPELFREASETCRAIDAMEDVHASSSYRQHLAVALTRRALETAHGRVGKGSER